jgi:hypothetical protein
MPSQREPLRVRDACEVLKQEPRKRRYGADLKRAIVDYAFARQDEQATIREIAAELDLSASLLGKWLRHARLRLEKGKIPSSRASPRRCPGLRRRHRQPSHRRLVPHPPKPSQQRLARLLLPPNTRPGPAAARTRATPRRLVASSSILWTGTPCARVPARSRERPSRARLTHDGTYSWRWPSRSPARRARSRKPPGRLREPCRKKKSAVSSAVDLGRPRSSLGQRQAVQAIPSPRSTRT